MATELGSMLIASTNPARLRDWYAETLQPTVDKTPDGTYDVLNFGGFYVLVDSRDDVGDSNPEPGRILLNFHVDDAKATVERINATGARWLAEPEDRDGSLFATAIDPDGNYVQIIQLSDEAKAEMARS